jgi:DNA-binding CsgD family transcriptional regulator
MEMSSDERDRRVVFMRSKGLTYQQIADALGMTRSGVRSVLIRVAEGRKGRPLR